jgi:hypothetical protein
MEIKQQKELAAEFNDILLITAPLTVTFSAPQASAILKAIAVKLGRKCTTVDFNALTLQWMTKLSQAQFASLKNFFLYGTTSDSIPLYVDQLLANLMTIVNQHQPKILAISLFSDDCRTATRLICQHMKDHMPDVKILIGGAGIAKGQKYGVSDAVSFGEKLKNQGLVDHYIIGDAEHSFQEFLQNNLTFPGIDSVAWQALNNEQQQNLSYPDYSDYDWKLYSEKAIGITGSRGCVRQCKFCDYIVYHPKFTWRSGQNIFDEMVAQQQRVGISHFEFSDSLVNGNLNAFRELIQALADHNAQPGNQRITWSGYFIMRSPTQFKEELWRLTAASGAKNLLVGIETFNDAARAKIGKKFTNQDIDFGIDMAIKYNINLWILFFVGSPEETADHIEETKQWLTQHTYALSNITIIMANTMTLVPGSWYDKNRDSMNIVIPDLEDRTSWYIDSTNNNFKTREFRHNLILRHCKALGYTTYSDDMLFSWLFDSVPQLAQQFAQHPK